MPISISTGGSYTKWKWEYSAHTCGAAKRKKRSLERKLASMGGRKQPRGRPLEVGDFRMEVDSSPCGQGWSQVTTEEECWQAAVTLEIEYGGAQVKGNIFIGKLNLLQNKFKGGQVIFWRLFCCQHDCIFHLI